MAKKEKEIKTNAMRILDRMKIPYEVLQYEVESFEDGVQIADLEGVSHEASFKTLVMKGKSGGYYVFVLPIEKETDLKAAARAAGEKSMEMIHVKDITAITGYVRGGCSPIGMKKDYPTIIAEEAKEFEKIYISGGRIGSTLYLKTEDLQKAARAKFAAFTV
ncbi:MAG: Cys-tRNA(Pro) deacylase [Lachnospiraceae bacterium]|nr:Cys-tRNA(Pro) deacylase [Lachnospiraceae bacterium]